MEQQKIESSKKSIERITALIDKLGNELATKSHAGIITDSDTQPFLKTFNTSMEAILKDAISNGYDFTNDDERIMQEKMAMTFQAPRTPAIETLVSQIWNTCAHIKQEKIESNIWNSTDRLLHFIHDFRSRLNQQTEIHTTEEINRLDEKIKSILAYDRETGFQYSRESDKQSMEKQIQKLSVEATQTKKAFEQVQADMTPLQYRITETMRDRNIRPEERKEIIETLQSELRAKNSESERLKAYEAILNTLIDRLKTQSASLLNPPPVAFHGIQPLSSTQEEKLKEHKQEKEHKSGEISRPPRRD